MGFSFLAGGRERTAEKFSVYPMMLSPLATLVPLCAAGCRQA